MRRVCLLALFALLAVGCAEAVQTAPAKVAPKRTYGDNAQRAYLRALDRFYDKNCLEAEPMMRNVRREYPYSRFAALADLRVGDCQFKDGKFAEAIETFNQFVRYRPSHSEVPYARFMAARSSFSQIPSEWLLSPPSYERDLHYAEEALRLLRRMILDFPDDPLVEKAQKLAVQTTELLAAHELYVARYYLGRGFPRAAIGRLNTLLRTYPGTALDAEALYLLGQSCEKSGDAPSAKLAFQRLIARYPSDARVGDARVRLSALGG